MSCNLLLVRHAKSSWDNADLQDFDRPLNKRGFKNAPEMGKRLLKKGLIINLIYSSPALRAITTAELIAKEIGYESSKIIYKPEIYEAGLSALFNVVKNIDENCQSAMLVGHNPGFTYLCNYLCNAQIDNMPTCSMAYIEFPVEDWKEIAEHNGKLVDFDYPKKK